MKINIIGGGPAGMYFAILMKQADPAHAITIYERNGPDDTFGWGVVFSGKTLANLRAADAESHAEITRAFAAWDNVDVVHGEERFPIHGNSFSGIARLPASQDPAASLRRVRHRACCSEPKCPTSTRYAQTAISWLQPTALTAPPGSNTRITSSHPGRPPEPLHLVRHGAVVSRPDVNVS